MDFRRSQGQKLSQQARPDYLKDPSRPVQVF
jgi:hypothetical protein